MQPSLVQYSVLFLSLAVFQPTFQKSIEAHDTGDSPHSRITRQVTDDQQLELPSKRADNVKPCPGGEDSCEETDDYPADRIKELLKDQPKVLLDLLKINEPTEDSQANRNNSGYITRFKLCPFEEVYLYPKKVKTERDTYEFIVNVDGYKQGVIAHQCLNDTYTPGRSQEPKSCAIPGHLPIGYKSICEQTYMKRSFLTYNSLTGSFNTTLIQLPSYCECVLTIVRQN